MTAEQLPPRENRFHQDYSILGRTDRFKRRCLWCDDVFVGTWNQKVCRKESCRKGWRAEVAKGHKVKARRAEVLRRIGARKKDRGDPFCLTCGDLLMLEINRLGQTIEWCVRCQVETMVTIRGHRRHDQRANLEKDMKAKAKTSMSFKKHYRGCAQRGETHGPPIKCGTRDADRVRDRKNFRASTVE